VKVASAAEAEYGALFMAAREAEAIRMTLADLGYPQQATSLICDNKCAVSLGNNTIIPKKSKSIDMNFHWVRDRIKQNHFTLTWAPGSSNLADFFTKAHAVKHHRAIRYLYVYDPPDGDIKPLDHS
jgi:hypothetical protein